MGKEEVKKFIAKESSKSTENKQSSKTEKFGRTIAKPTSVKGKKDS